MQQLSHVEAYPVRTFGDVGYYCRRLLVDKTPDCHDIQYVNMPSWICFAVIPVIVHRSILVKGEGQKKHCIWHFWHCWNDWHCCSCLHGWHFLYCWHCWIIDIVESVGIVDIIDIANIFDTEDIDGNVGNTGNVEITGNVDSVGIIDIVGNFDIVGNVDNVWLCWSVPQSLSLHFGAIWNTVGLCLQQSQKRQSPTLSPMWI